MDRLYNNCILKGGQKNSSGYCLAVYAHGNLQSAQPYKDLVTSETLTSVYCYGGRTKNGRQTKGSFVQNRQSLLSQISLQMLLRKDYTCMK